MSGVTTIRRAVIGLAAGVLLGACSESSPPADGASATGSVDPRSSAIFGQAPQEAHPDEARRIATRAVQTVSSQCGGGCSADVDAGRAHLAAGRMQEAFAALRCADTPEAAFGAGIAKLLGAIESPAADQLLEDVAEEPFPASDLFGPEGYLARLSGRWNGTAELMVQGALQMSFTTKRAMADDWELAAHYNEGGSRVSFFVESDEGWTPGTVLQVRYDCANFGRATGAMPRVQLTVVRSDERIECEARSASAACDPDGGSMKVIANGVTPGARVEYEFTNLQLVCDRSSDLDSAAPIVASPPPELIRISGRASAMVSGEIDTSDLHAVFDDDKDERLIERIDAVLPLTTFMNHAAAVAGEIAGARCYFDKAAAGSGTVFTAPGSMYGGRDLPLDAADARLFGAAASAGAAFVELAAAYEMNLPLRTMICSTHGDLNEHVQCPTDSAFVESVNDAWKAARVRHDRIEAAHQLVTLALADLEAGAPRLGEDSAFTRNAVSAPGWAVIEALAHAARQSLASGNTAVPYIGPAVHADLRAFFASPPDPMQISEPLLFLREDECGSGPGFECETDIEVQARYVDAFFDDTDADLVDGDYEFSETQSRALEDAVREVMLQLDSGLFTGG